MYNYMYMVAVPERQPTYQLDREPHLPYRVNSENISYYLLPDVLDFPAADFAPHLSLPDFTPGIERIRAYSLPVYLHSAEDRQQLRQTSQPPTGTLLKDHFTDQQRKQAASRDEQVEGEVGLSYYYDALDDGIHTSELFIGDVDSVNHNLFDLLKAGKYPIEVDHRHRYNSLQSAPDYVPFLISPYKDKRQRLVKASKVVCPDVTDLYVTTSETMPTMPKEEIQEFLGYWENRFDTEGQAEIEALDMEVKGIYLANRAQWESQMDKGIAELRQWEDKRRQGQLSNREEEQFNWERNRLQALNSSVHTLSEQPDFVAAKKSLDDLIMKIDHAVRLELLKVVGLKHYRSTNNVDFYAM